MDKKVLDNKCPSCSAPLKYNGALGKFKCDYCDSEFTMEELKNKTNASKDDYNEVKKDEVQHEEQILKQVDNTEYVSYNCPDCGAEIIADENTASTFCVYCGNTSIIKSRLSGQFAPTKIIPFKTEKQQAIDAFKNLSKGRPLMPKMFNNEANIEKIQGVYIPFWLYDFSVQGGIRATATKVKSWTSGEYHYTKTDTYNVTRAGAMHYEKIPVDGSTRFDNDIMNSLEPFYFHYLEDYNHAYLSGFLAEKYDVDSTKAMSEASSRAISSARNVMLADMKGYNTKAIKDDTLSINELDKKVEYVLLPVWMVNVKYKGKMYIFAMNGQTGEFIGDIPLDTKKAVITSILLFVLCFALVMIVAYLAYLGGA